MAYVLWRPRHAFPRAAVVLRVLHHAVENSSLVLLYIWIAQGLRLQDTLWVLILPYLFRAVFVSLLHTYFASLPEEISTPPKWMAPASGASSSGSVVPLSTPDRSGCSASCSIVKRLGRWHCCSYQPAGDAAALRVHSIITTAHTIMANRRPPQPSAAHQRIFTAMAVLHHAPAALRVPASCSAISSTSAHSAPSSAVSGIRTAPGGGSAYKQDKEMPCPTQAVGLTPGMAAHFCWRMKCQTNKRSAIPLTRR